MRIYKVKDYEEMSRRAAMLLAAQVAAKPDSVLGLATGSTPVGAYRYLRKWYAEGLLDFSRVQAMNLDEYRGISRENPQSYYFFMRENLFDHINIKKENTHIPDGEREDGEAVCQEYEELVRSAGVDLQLLGIGRNGHIGFNEPAENFSGSCRRVDLAQSTIEANKRFFSSEAEVPRQAYTMGIGTIMGAEKILLLASGEDKAEAVCQMICGPITPVHPASVLQLHRNVTVIADEAALSKTKITEGR